MVPSPDFLLVILGLASCSEICLMALLASTSQIKYVPCQLAVKILITDSISAAF